MVAPDRRSNVVILPLTAHASFPFLYLYTATSVAPGLFLRDSGRACPSVVPPRGCSAAGAVGAGRVVEPGTVGARGRKKGGRAREQRDVRLRDQQVVKCAFCREANRNERKGSKNGKERRNKQKQNLSLPTQPNTTHPQTQLGAMPRRRLLLRRVGGHAFLAPPSLPPSFPASRASSSWPGRREGDKEEEEDHHGTTLPVSTGINTKKRREGNDKMRRTRK